MANLWHDQKIHILNVIHYALTDLGHFSTVYIPLKPLTSFGRVIFWVFMFLWEITYLGVPSHLGLFLG